MDKCILSQFHIFQRKTVEKLLKNFLHELENGDDHRRHKTEDSNINCYNIAKLNNIFIFSLQNYVSPFF